MVPANKILTVSYGTFSCTLEGFDDPFSTMTDIAEYFRDLAADDRFFGAEPPIPDMAMLRMIAETRARHAVTARPGEGGVVLSPSTVGADADADAQDTADAGSAGVSVGDIAAGKPGGEAPAPQPQPEDMASRLDRIRNVVSADRQSSFGYSEDEHAADPIDDSTDDPADPPTDASPDQLADDAVAAAFRDDPLADGAVGDRGSEESKVDVKARANAEAPETDASETIETVEPGQVGAAPVGTRTIGIRRIRSTQEAEVAIAAAPNDGDDAAAASVDDLDDANSVVEPTAIEADPGHDAIGPEATGDDDLNSEFLAGLDRDDIAERLPHARDDDILGLLSLDDEEEASAPDGDDLAAAPAAIRAADSSGATPTQDTPAFGPDDIDLSDVDEAGPVVARIEDAGVEYAEADGKAAGAAEGDAIMAGSGAEAAPDDVMPSGPDMERLFAATDSRLSGEDTSRRHANISHLKAAVAARRADGPIGPRTEKETDAYRADLANSVRPRRTSRPAEMPRAERPSRPAPLVLVSAQRVVETPGDEAPAAPVQPRSAAHMREAETREQDTLQLDGTGAGGEDFERFAADVGATELPDILEAAAVYSARIMGQDNFSRPRLLHLAAEACDDLSREDGLRGFGQLLRDGRIRKVGRGTFALVGESRYAADADRRVG